MICSSSLSQVTTSQNCVKLLFDVIKLAVRFQKDVSEAWIKVRYMLQSLFPYLFGLLDWAWAFLVIKCGIKRQMLALHFTESDFILQEKKNEFWAMWSLKVLENVLLEISISWYEVKFNFKLHFSVNHEAVSCPHYSVPQFLSRTWCYWECPCSNSVFSYFFECLLDSLLLARSRLLTLIVLLQYRREICEQCITDFWCLPFMIWFWNIVLYCSLTACLFFFLSGYWELHICVWP